MRKDKLVELYARRSAGTERVRAWRKRNHRKLLQRAISTPAEERKRRALSEAFLRGHEHTCLVPRCRKPYPCRSACNPNGLKESLCPDCFRAAADEVAHIKSLKGRII